MKKDIKKLVKEIFKDEVFFEALGFTFQESRLLHLLVNGESVSTIATELDLSYSVVNSMKSRSLYLLPIYMHRKLTAVNTSDFKTINTQLLNLNESINSYLLQLGQNNVYDVRELNLSKRTINALIASNIKNTNDILGLSKKGLMQIKNLGTHGFCEIEKELVRLNLRLKDARD